MIRFTIEALVSVAPRMVEIGRQLVAMLEQGAVEVILVYMDSDEAKKLRSGAQNRLIYKIYQRIGKTLYGGDESHARNECKLRIGCRILYRDSKDFAFTFDNVIRNLDYEKKLNAMTLISVSSIMSVGQGTEYIKTIMSEYGAKGVYFLDLEGADQYVDYPEAQQ